MNIPFESKLDGIKNVRKRNEVYKSLSLEDRRREIGYDILRNFLLGKILKQEHARYWPEEVAIAVKNITDPIEFQEKIIECTDKILCSVCARGAIMVSRIALGNTIAGHDDWSFSDGENRAGESIIEEFDIVQLERMETAYENTGFAGYKARTPECIAAIGANLIANGEFEKYDEANYLKQWGIPISEQSEEF